MGTARRRCHDQGMSARLVERDGELDALTAAVASAATGEGQVVLVTGEAGIGKTSLVDALVGSLPSTVRVLAGACDDLITPRTLGPLRDAVAGTDTPLSRALAAGTRDDVYDSVLDELGRHAPTLLVVEDVHWADDGTLDVLRFVSGRVARTAHGGAADPARPRPVRRHAALRPAAGGAGRPVGPAAGR